MTTQPTVKAHNKFDVLCWVFTLAGLLCLGTSFPATFEMVKVAHDDTSAIFLMLVLELMAFFSLLAPLWVPTWAKEFNRIALVLLGITTIGNYAAGWNYVWTKAELTTFWRGIRDWWLGDPSFTPLTILLVGVLSAMVPVGMKFFLGLAVKRYRENEMDQTPEAVAQRAVEPMQVQILAVRAMQEHLLQLTQAFQSPLVLPAAAQPQLTQGSADLDLRAEVERLREQERQRQESVSFPAVRELERQITEMKRQAARAQAEQLDREITGGFTPRTEASVVAPAALDEDEDSDDQHWVEDDLPASLIPNSLDELIAQSGYSRERLRDLAQNYTPERAYKLLKTMFYIDDRVPYARFRIWWDELMAPQASTKAYVPPRKLDEVIAELPADRQAAVHAQAEELAAEYAAQREELKLWDVTLMDGLEPEVWPQAVTEAPGPWPAEVLAEEVQTSAPAQEGGDPVMVARCSGCTADMTSGELGQAARWSNKRGLGAARYCKTCRDSGQYGV